jgi:hypothetical protein
VCLDNQCTECDASGTLAGCPCPESGCALDFYCDIDTVCQVGGDCNGVQGDLCLTQNRACVRADGISDARCAECLDGFAQNETGECVACNGDYIGCDCVDGACSTDANLFCSNDVCASTTVSEADCDAQLRSYTPTNGTEDASCGECIADTVEENGECRSCLGEIGCACEGLDPDNLDVQGTCDGDAVCSNEECISFEDACDSVDRVAGCVCDDTLACIAGNVCVDGACTSCDGRNDLVGCGCINDACTPGLYCDGNICAQGTSCEGAIQNECNALNRVCDEANGRVDAQCGACNETSRLTDTNTCHPCNGDYLTCPCVNGACDAGSDLYCSNDVCVASQVDEAYCTGVNRTYNDFGGTQESECGECVDNTYENNSECTACGAIPQGVGCACTDQCADGLFCSNGQCQQANDDTTLGCSAKNRLFVAANGTNDAYCGECINNYPDVSTPNYSRDPRVALDANTVCTACGLGINDQNCDGCSGQTEIWDQITSTCRAKNLCADITCEQGVPCLSLDNDYTDDACQACPGENQQLIPVLDNDQYRCVDTVTECNVSAVQHAVGIVGYLETAGRCLFLLEEGYFYSPSYTIEECDKDGDGWISFTAFNAHPYSGETDLHAYGNRCRLNVIKEIELAPAFSPRAETQMNTAQLFTLQNLKNAENIELDFEEEYVVMTEPDDLDELVIGATNTNRSYLLYGTSNNPIPGKYLNPFTKGCGGTSKDFNLTGDSESPNLRSDIGEELQEVQGAYTSQEAIDPLKQVMKEMSFYMELYSSSFSDLGQATYLEGSPYLNYTNMIVREVRFQIQEKSRDNLGFQYNPNSIQDGLNEEFKTCTVYGDSRRGTTRKLGLDFAHWLHDSANYSAYGATTEDLAQQAMRQLDSVQFRTVLRHHSQFKCIYTATPNQINSFWNNAGPNAEQFYSQDVVLFDGNSDDFSIPVDNPDVNVTSINSQEQRLKDGQVERYRRQNCAFTSDDSTRGTGQPAEATFNCSYDEASAVGKVQWGIVVYRADRENQTLANVRLFGNADTNPLGNYVRGCINECAVSRGRFMRECYLDVKDLEDADVVCASPNECQSGEECDGGYCKQGGVVANRRKDAVATCLDDLFENANPNSTPYASRTAPYLCRGYDYDPNDSNRFIPTACSVSSRVPGQLRCGCATGYTGVDAQGNLDCSFGCPGDVPADQSAPRTGFLLNSGVSSDEETSWESAIQDEYNAHDGNMSSADELFYRYRSFIRPQDAVWMCIEPYGSAYSDEDATTDSSTDFKLLVGGVPGYVAGDPAVPFELD